MMIISKKSLLRGAVISMALTLMASGAFAAKPDGAGGGKNKEVTEFQVENPQTKQGKNVNRKNTSESSTSRSNDININQYTGNQSNKKDCPPGLAKKKNGCLPPGQEKKQPETTIPVPVIRLF
jgi:hypothetical protein